MNFLTFYENLPENERLLVDILRQFIVETIPGCKEKFSWGVPNFYRNRSICIMWPSSVPGGGFKEGVFLGFFHGHRLNDEDNYLHHGTNKKVFYRIFKTIEEIGFDALEKLLRKADQFDLSFKK